ncbi:hypothetical protein BH10ACT4_BH10ACT4_04040 [soil metagenome]
MHWHTLAMVRLRGVAAAAVLIAVALLLAGCAPSVPAAEATPLSALQRAIIRNSILDSKWAQVASEYPEAIRPAVTISPTVPDHDWAPAMVECLKSAGVVAYILNGEPVYGSAGQTPLEVAVRYYACEAAHPSESQVASHLSRSQSAALYDYYLLVVRPCLLTAGAPSPASPDRSAAEGLAGLAGWNPYQVIWTSSMPATTQAYLEQRCPPTPAWLDLGP